MKRIFKRSLYLLAAVAVVGALIYAFQPQPAQVDVAEVRRGPMRVTIDEEGETRIDDRFVISAPVAGRVLRISLRPGDPVQAGATPIATFLPGAPPLLDARARTEAEARVRLAEAALDRARSSRDGVAEQLAFAEAQLARYTDLAEEGLVAREQYDLAAFEVRRLREGLNTAEFEVRDAERAVDVARAALFEADAASQAAAGAPVTLRSPIGGVVLRRFRESEAVVPAGEPLVEVGNTANLEIVSDLLSADAVQVRPGGRVLIEQWGGGATLEGRVQRVEPSGFTKLSALGVEEQRVNVIIDFVDRAAAAAVLGDGYRVEVRLIIWEDDDALIVPTSALFRDGEAWAVFTVADGMAALRRVEIGQRNGLEAEVLSGLAESDPVIVHPSADVADGVHVAPRM